MEPNTGTYEDQQTDNDTPPEPSTENTEPQSLSDVEATPADESAPVFSGKRLLLNRVADDENGNAQFVVADNGTFVAHFEENPDVSSE